MSDVSKTCERLRNGAAGLVMQARLAQLEGYHVEFRCTCGHTVKPAVTMLIRRFGVDRRLAEIVDRATCRHCGAKPNHVSLNEIHNPEFCYGAAAGWSVQLIPFLPPASERRHS